MPFDPLSTNPSVSISADPFTDATRSGSTLAVPSTVNLDEKTYLKFRLNAQTPAALAVRAVQEAFILPARQLTAMPDMPAAVLGLTNRRNRVIWVIDLAYLLGLSIFDVTAQHYSLVLVQVGMIQLGLAVQQIEGMTRLTDEAIQAPVGQMSVSLLPYLQGCALQQQAQRSEILLILNAEAIVQAPALSHPSD